MVSVARGNTPVAQNVRRIIEEQVIPHYIIARRAGFNPQQLSDMLNGRRIIRPCDIETLRKVLGVEYEELFAPIRG